LLVFYFFHILVISVGPIISTSTRPIFTKFCRIGRTSVVDERSEVIFFRSLRGVVVATNLWTKSTYNSHLVVHMRFARAAPPAYDKKAGRRQTNYLIRWMQANQLSNKLTTINRRLEEG